MPTCAPNGVVLAACKISQCSSLMSDVRTADCQHCSLLNLAMSISEVLLVATSCAALESDRICGLLGEKCFPTHSRSGRCNRSWILSYDTWSAMAWRRKIWRTRSLSSAPLILRGGCDCRRSSGGILDSQFKSC